MVCMPGSLNRNRGTLREIRSQTTSFTYLTLSLPTSPNPAKYTGGRRCLLKGCGKRFVPRPQDRLRAKYCPECRKEAKKWRSWLSRRSPKGKKAKRLSNKRFRNDRPEYFSSYRRRCRDRIRTIERESKRRLRKRTPEDVHKVRPMEKVPCHRPGCYVLYLILVSLRGIRRYCGGACRGVMRHFITMLAQLRYRRTDVGNYKRKLSRGNSEPP